ncbi:VCBS repeat-containing protein [Bradyrhizobium sp. LM3.4]
MSVSLGDAPNYVYKDAGLHDVTGSLTSLQKQDIAATLINIDVVAKGGNTNTGSAVWTYTIPDHVFDFLAAGETLTLTYTVRVANNFTVSPDTATRTITITITGTNDKPVITSSVPTITFEGGTSVAGGPLTSEVPTSGTLTFKDVDLTDTHTVAVKLTSATLPDGTVPPGPLAMFQSAMSAAIAAGADSKGSGTGTINWSLADLPVYLADFIPKGEVLTLVYTVTLTDAQGATSQQTITVTITGTDAAAVVWIATDQAGAPSGGFWKDAANWETGTVPTSNDDVIVITDQLHGLTPSYPVTIDTAAYAKSLTLDDYDTAPHHKTPEVVNKSTLTIGGKLTLNADAKFTNSFGSHVIVGGAIDVGTITRTPGVVVINTSTITNAGTFTLAAGGTIDTLTAIANSGTIDLSGGTLVLKSDVANTGGTVQADAGTMLIVDTATISGGTVTIAGTLELDGTSVIKDGTLNNSSAVNVKGAAKFAHETVSNTGNVTVYATGKLTVNGATISGAGTITNDGEIDLNGNAILSGGVLNNNAIFNVSGTGNALDGETVTNAGTIEVLANGVLAIDHGSTVNNSSGSVIVDATAALTLDNATISGGAINGGGTIHLTGASKIDGGATLSVSAVTADAKLTLDGVTVSGSTITDNSSIELDNTVKLKDAAKIQGGAITNNGTLEIAGAATLLNDVLTNTGHIVKVDDGQTLTLSGTEITGGTIDNYSVLGGTIDVTGDSKIDGNATLNKGAVAIETGVTLTLDDATVVGTAITNGGIVKVDTSKKLTLAGASLTGGTLTVVGTLASSDATTITDANISNNYLLESTLGGLLALVATTPAAAITNSGTIQANHAELDVNGEAVANSGTLAAINNGTLKLISATVTNSGSGTVSVELGSTLDLAGATIDGGTVTISGTLESTGTSAINNGDITNNGTITVTSGTLTIDPATTHAITNYGLIQASGAELDVSGEDISNTAALKAINYGTLKLANLTVSNSSTGAVTVDGHSKLYLTNITINDGSLSNAGNLYSVSGLNTITGGVTNAGTIEVLAGTLNLSGGLSGGGSLIIDGGATFELGGADAQTVTFAGGTDTLQLDKVAGQIFTGTIAGQSTKAGTFTIQGAADITASSGDALDFTASGGTSAAPADIVLALTGTLTGAASGIVVTQNGAGDVSLTATGGAVGGAYGIDAVTQGDGDVTIVAGGNITGTSVYGIRARSYGAGSEAVTTAAGSVVTSGSSGIVAVNRATSLDGSDHSTITVNAYGTINSGSSLNQSGNTPAGIQAGYNGATTGSSANIGVNGSVVVNNHANVTAAAGCGIHAYNYGNGNVTVNDAAGTTVVGAEDGIRAQALSGGTGDVSVTLGAGASVTGTTSYGILAYSIDASDISVTMASGDSIISGSSGVVAVNYATAIASGVGSTITVEAHGIIHSGSISNNDGTIPGAIIAGYKPGGNGVFSSAVKGDVTVTSDATIIADAGYGIEAFTWGAGNVAVTTGATSSITAAGTAIGAFDHGGGDVNVTNNGSAAGAVGVSAIANGSGDITIVNHGGITSTSLAGISVTQNEAGATGSTHITNTGSIVAPSAHAAIFIQENTTGLATIDNSVTGTIGPAIASTVTSTTYAIVETGGAITINNAGHINGNISVATAAFNNELGGTWTVSGTSVFGSLSSISNAGEIDLFNGASISGTSLSIANSHDIESWGTASISGTIINIGSIEVHTGTLTLFGSLSGAGSATVDAGALLKVEDAVSQTIALAGDGASLQIDTSTFGGSIAQLSAGDKIDLSSIVYDDGTSATYNATTGELVVSDVHNHTITLKLTGADYSNAHFAGSSDGHGGTLITFNAADDAPPAFTAAGATLTATGPELQNTTGSSALDPASGGTGSIVFKDIDLTDRPTATITGPLVIALDHTTAMTLTPDQITALEHALTLQQAGNTNNGTVAWNYSIADKALDFLGAGQTAQVVSTITLDDGHKTDTTQVTVTIAGANDAPALNVDQASVTQVGDQVTVHGLSVADPDTNDTFTIAATAASGAAVNPSTGGGSLAIVNSALQAVTYTEASSGGPAADMVTVTVTDAHNASDTVNLIFNLTEAGPVALTGTTDKDVFFGTGYQDQFVFATNSNHDTIVNFTSGTNHIDLSFVGVSNVSDWMAHHVAASGADTLITIDAADTILVKGVSLQTNDFILHVT